MTKPKPMQAGAQTRVYTQGKVRAIVQDQGCSAMTLSNGTRTVDTYRVRCLIRIQQPNGTWTP